MSSEANPLHVTVLTTSYPRHSGDEASIFVGRMVEAFSAAGIVGRVIVPRDDQEPAVEQQGGFVVHRYQYGVFQKGKLAFGAGIMPNLRKSPLLFFQIPGLLTMMGREAFRAREDTRVYHANWVVSGLVAAVVSCLTGKPFVVTLRGEDVRLLRKRLLGRPFRAVLRRADRVTSVNESFLSEVQRLCHLSPEKLVCIPNGVALQEPAKEDECFADEQLKRVAGGSIGIFVGTVIPRKGVSTLLQLLCAPELQELSLVVCGRVKDKSYHDGLLKVIEERGLQSRVSFLGSCTPGQVVSLLKRSTLYLSASEHEGRSNSLLEAQAAGLPCVVSDIPGHREVIEDGKNGLLFQLQDVPAAVKAVCNVLENTGLGQQMGEAGKVFTRGLTWQKTAMRYAELFSRCIQDRP